jgi:hypothetical protein
MLTNLDQGDMLLGDPAYDSDALRQSAGEQGGWSNVKPMPSRTNALSPTSP